VSEVTTDDISRLVAELQREGFAASTIVNILVPTGQVFDHAVRRGLTPANPVRGLERHERPKIRREEMRILDRHEIEALLGAASENYRPLLAAAIFLGLRLGELLGLRWGDVDFGACVVRVRRQAYRTGEMVPLKTAKARRDVLLQPALAHLLREHRLRSGHSQPDDFVFHCPDGRPMHPDVVRSCRLHAAVKKAGLDPAGKQRLRFHDLRHTYASLLIAQGVNVAFVSRQLGHASITTTLNVYTHLFDHAENASTVIGWLEEQFGGIPSAAGSEAAAAATLTALPALEL
jgi:integrase